MSYALSPQLAADSLKGRGLAIGTDRADTSLGGRAVLPLDLRALTAEAFGYAGLRRYQVPAGPSPEGNDGFYATQAGQLATTAPTNMFGLPVFVQVNFGAVGGSADRMAFYGLSLLDPLVTVGEPFNIVKTPITGRRGTVKEYIGKGDYGVTIRGILATDVHAADRLAYPLTQVRQLEQLVNLGAAVPVSGWLLDTFGIKNLVFENVRYEALPGFVNLQAYELECVSDDPIELEL